MKFINKLVYRPSRFILIVDLTIVLTVIFATLLLAPFTNPKPLQKYTAISVFYLLQWFLISYFAQRYKPYKQAKYFKSIVRLVFAMFGTVLVMAFFNLLFPHTNYSLPVFIFIALNSLVGHLLVYFFYFSVRYAVEYTDPVRRKQTLKPPVPPVQIDDHRADKIWLKLSSLKGEKVVEFLKKHLNPVAGKVQFVGNKDYSAHMQTGSSQHRVNTFLLTDPLNELYGINTLFFYANTHLVDQGLLVCCFEQKSTRKKRILTFYPPIIRWVVYINDFFIQRFLPKLVLGRRLYYRIFRKSYRILHKTEVLGRLCYLGFSIVATKKIDGLVYVIACKQSSLKALPPLRIYGPLIKLRRSGKQGKSIIVYKLRTMYSYSEFLQEYMYENYNLQEGGKFKKDIRISGWGKFLRRYFIDELPMIWNIIKGDLKLVGVRPLSNQYLSLYNKELVELRNRFKPGFLPPFYADLPGTLDEIQLSEQRYLESCRDTGVFITDCRYFIRIVYNILFRKVKSS